MNDLLSLFMVCVFPTHFWAFYIFLHDLPGFIMHYQPFEVIGILAYIMAYALLESFIIGIILIAIAFFLPRGWLLDNFAAKAFILVVITSLWLVLAQFWIWNQIAANDPTSGFQQALSSNWITVLIWAITWIGMIVGLLVVLNRSKQAQKILGNTVDRLLVLSLLFLIADVISIGIIILRNIG